MNKLKELFGLDNRKKINSFIKQNRQWFILGGAVVLTVIMFLVVIWNTSENKTMKADGETYRYLMGVKLEYSEDMQLVRDDTGTVIEDSDKVSSDGAPIIYKEEKRLILPVSMGFMRPFNENSLKRVNYFATITKKGDVIEINNNGNIVETNEGFMYDGNGTYLFMEDVVVEIGNVSYELKALSYVKEVYGQCVEIYDVTTEFYKYINLVETDAIVTSSNGYSVNLGTGVMTIGETQRILFSDIEAMGVLK